MSLDLYVEDDSKGIEDIISRKKRLQATTWY